ncbi:MAG TPA: HIT domain-containing protein [Armatimonadota bacterium]|nr:HIT domain-containing protein [Armatimonadota bacterium]
MERLWAPWRVQYIMADQPEGCIFCVKPKENRDRENLILERDDLAFIMLNAYPYNNGHLMAAPYRHTGDISDLNDDEILSVMRMVKLGKEVLAKAFSPDGFNIGINMGHTAGAGIADHIHIHIVPRWNGDTNFMPVIADTKVMPQALCDTYDQLKKALSDLKGDNLQE